MAGQHVSIFRINTNILVLEGHCGWVTGLSFKDQHSILRATVAGQHVLFAGFSGSIQYFRRPQWLDNMFCLQVFQDQYSILEGHSGWRCFSFQAF